MCANQPSASSVRPAGGERAWKEVLSGFWDPFTQQLGELGGARCCCCSGVPLTCTL